MKTIYRIDENGYIHGLRTSNGSDHEFADHEVCQPHNWLPRGRLTPIAMSSSEPYLPRLIHGTIFDFFDGTVKCAPAILEIGDGGFLFAEVTDLNGKRGFGVDGRFVVPIDWSKHEFFLQLLTFLVSGHDPSMRDAFGLYFDEKDKNSSDFVFMCKTRGVFEEIGTFPKIYTVPMVRFLETSFSAPLFDFDYNTMSLKQKRF